MTQTGNVEASSTRDVTAKTSKFRKDIEGLRAIAVVLVLVWHAEVTQLSGGFIGVDIFFVISGFLMAQILLRDLEQRQTLRVWNFYARRARRLIPASGTVLVFTAVATYFLLPEGRWRNTGIDIGGASAYVVNWVLARRSVDYLAQGSASSPVQHFWSLSVEEQFYIVWPVVLAALGLLVLKRVRLSPRAAVGMLLAVVFVGSLACSIHLTSADPGRAYFVTTTRAWELALGGLVVIGLPLAIRLPAIWAVILAWAGIATILATAVVLTTSVPFPGWVALFPTVGTALVIASGVSAGERGPVAMLKNRPVQWVGRCSYSLYLWHWPVLVIGGYVITDGMRDTTVFEGVFLVALSCIPAALSLYLVEDTTRNSQWLQATTPRALALAAAGIAIGLVAGLALVATGPKPYASADPARYLTGNSQPGAAVLQAEPRADDVGAPANSDTITPNPVSALYDFHDCPVTPVAGSSVIACPVSEGAKKVVIVGDSHAQQWIPAFIRLADERDWGVVAYLHDACPFAAGKLVRHDRVYQSCMDWNRVVQSTILADSPDLVVTSFFGKSATMGQDALAGAWRPLVEADIPVAVIRDTPLPEVDFAECVSTHLDNLATCSKPRSEMADPQGVDQMAAAEKAPGVTPIDLNDAICPTDRCAAVIGGVLVYRDTNHISGTYAASLAPHLGDALPPV